MVAVPIHYAISPLLLDPPHMRNTNVEEGLASSRLSFSCCLIAGVCLGMQIAVVEFARNILGWKDAHSTEFNSSTEHPVVIEMPEHNTGHMGATMRLGKRKTIFKSKQSILSKLITEFFESFDLVMKEGINCVKKLSPLSKST